MNLRSIVSGLILLIFIGILFMGFTFWALIHYMVYRAFYFKHIKEKHRPDPKIFPFHEIMIETEAQKKVQLYDLNPDSDSSVVILAIHGWANTSEIFLPMAEHLSTMSHIFLLNARNHGKSDEERLMNILKFKADLQSAVNYVESIISGNKKLIVIGHSLGAAASILTAAEDQRVHGVVSISSFADLQQIMFQGFLQSKVPAWLINVVLKYIELRIGRSLDEISPINSISRFNRPVLLIHGNRDELVPFHDLDRIRQAAKRENVDTYIAEGHSHSSLLKDIKVAEAVRNFLNKYFIKS